MVSRAARTLFALSAVAAALSLTLATMQIGQVFSVVQSNFMLVDPRHQLIGLILGAVFLAFAAGTIFVFRHGEQGLEALAWLTRLFCPLVLLPLVLTLTQRGFGSDLEQAGLLTVFVLAFEKLMQVSLSAWAQRPHGLEGSVPPFFGKGFSKVSHAIKWYFDRPKVVLATVIILAVAHSIFVSVWTIWQHQRFATYGYDTGQYDQLFATTLHGKWLAAPTQGNPQNWGDLAGSHADFIIFPLLPIYALFPRTVTLLAMQAVLVGTAAIPLYLFARRWLSIQWALVMAIAWLGYAPMHTAQMYGLHTQIFGAPFVLWAIFAIEYRKWVLYWVFFLLALSCREDVAMGLAATGLFFALTGYRLKTGLATAVLATCYFFIIRFKVMPNQGFANLYSGLAAFGGRGFGAILMTLITNPVFAIKSLLTLDKIRFVLQMMAPLAFLPVRRPTLWLVLVPAAILTLFTTAYGPTVSIHFQYIFNWLGYAFPAAVVALSLLGKMSDGLTRQRAAGITVLVGTLLGNLLWGVYTPTGTISGGFAQIPFERPSEADRQRQQDLESMMEKIPTESSVCTADRIQPHTTHHLLNWSLRDGLFDCEFLLWSNLPGDLGSDRAQRAVSSRQYKMIESVRGVFLAQKASAAETPKLVPLPPVP